MWRRLGVIMRHIAQAVAQIKCDACRVQPSLPWRLISFLADSQVWRLEPAKLQRYLRGTSFPQDIE